MILKSAGKCCIQKYFCPLSPWPITQALQTANSRVGSGIPVTGKVSPFSERFVCCVKTLQHDTSYLSNPDLQRFTIRSEVIWSPDMTIHIPYSVHKMFCCLQEEKIVVWTLSCSQSLLVTSSEENLWLEIIINGCLLLGPLSSLPHSIHAWHTPQQWLNQWELTTCHEREVGLQFPLSVWQNNTINFRNHLWFPLWQAFGQISHCYMRANPELFLQRHLSASKVHAMHSLNAAYHKLIPGKVTAISS